MSKLLTFSLALLVFAGADIPGSERLRPSTLPGGTFSPADEIGLFPGDPAAEQQADAPKKAKADTLPESSKLELIRYASGQFAKAPKNRSACQGGVLPYVGKPLRP